MFEFDQDFALGWLGYSHKTQQTHNRATKEIDYEHRKFRVVLGLSIRKTKGNLINGEGER
jgi:hypothetical protein